MKKKSVDLTTVPCLLHGIQTYYPILSLSATLQQAQPHLCLRNGKVTEESLLVHQLHPRYEGLFLGAYLRKRDVLRRVNRTLANKASGDARAQQRILSV